MRKIVVCAASVALIASVAFAKSYPKEDLKKINQYLAKLIEGEPGSRLEVTRADVGGDKRISRTVLEAGARGFSVAADLRMSGKTVVARAEISEDNYEDELTPEEIHKELRTLADKVNKEGFYKAEVKVKSKEGMVHIEFSIVPASKEAVSIESLKVAVVVTTGEKKSLRARLEGKFNVTSDLVLNGRESLTRIFDKIAAGSFPQEEDFAGLLRILQEISKFLNSRED